MVLLVALIAPVVLASGMLMADYTGYGERARGDFVSDAAVRAEPAGMPGEGRAGVRPPAGTPGAQPTAGASPEAPEAPRIAVVPMARVVREPLLDPTPVPEPTGPARLYERLVRILPVVRPVREVVIQGNAPAARRPAEAKPSPREETTFTCAPEWRDTWLWELCQEQQARPDGGE
ncbi:hypothetical protein [Microbispora sp. H11081]|uniref:hypothetical protein n=1 Tax=Microbispora sp. H11081 TaxID=2729107 RepID=UPI0014730861|nr:hypothetical protein [Microbispora sp. H11081]